MSFARIPLRFAAVLSILITLLTFAPAQEAHAQEVANREPPAPAVTADQLEKLREDLRAGRERIAPLVEALDVSAAEDWVERSPIESLSRRAADPLLAEAETEKGFWQTAVAHEQAAVERVRGALNRAALATTAVQRLEELDEQVDAMFEFSSEAEAAPEERSLTQIEEDIATLNSERAQGELEIDQRRQTLARLEEQLRTQANTLDELRRSREQELAAVKAEPVAEPELLEAQAAAHNALDRRTNARILAAQIDAATLTPRMERLRLELRTQELEQALLRTRIAKARADYLERSTEELRSLAADLQRLIEREPEVQQLYAAELSAMRRQIDEIAEVQSRVRALQLEREQNERTEEDLIQTLANVRERLEVGGLTETLGGLFLEEQQRLRALGDKRFALNGIERALSQSRLHSITLREQLRATPAPEPGRTDAGSAQTELQRIRHRLAAALVQSEESLTEQLRQTQARLTAVVALVDELDQVLRETLLWWPSHLPVSLEWAARIPAALLALLDARAWQEIRSAMIAVTVGSPGASLLTLLGVALLWRSGRRTGRHLRALADKTRHRFTDNIGLTLKAMGWSLLRVLPVPVLLISTSFRLEQIPETGPGVEILAAVLRSAAVWWLAGYLVVLFISRNGVGTVHFDWNPCMLQRLRRNLAWYLPLQFILIIALALAFAHPSDLVFDVMGRAGLIAACATTGTLAWRLFAPSPDLIAVLTERNRRLVRAAVVSCAAALVALAAAGYLLTVGELFAHAIDTVVVVGLVWLCYRLAARALILSETQLRIRRMFEQRTKAAAAETNSVAERAPDMPEPQLSMEDVNLQTRTLVRVLAGGVMVLALFWVWAEILPALIWLDGVTLWSRTIVTGGSEVVTRMSLQDLLLAVSLLVLFAMATRNLPGLVEILLARSTRMDGTARYTVMTLLRYTIIVAAVVIVFSLLGLRWSELQWLIAALTLGLGFGLQEVVANFFSGLIMLFERPVRLGDTITIGEFNGTVARIRTRATTIIDWDNREVVVPNKMFITERLINWSLSDTMTRIVLTIRISYHADVDVVMQSLKEIADEHPLVMADPAPTVLLLKLGDSALTFEMRAYVNQLRDRLETISDLHRKMLHVFRERGIEIAYPQMDLHIRDGGPVATRGTATLPSPAAGLYG